MLTSALGLALAWSTAMSAPPADMIGQPVALVVQPAALTLTGPRSLQQMVVTGRYADDCVRDLTPWCEFAPEAADMLSIGAGGLVRPRRDGQTTLVIKAGGQEARVPVVIREFSKPLPIGFRHEMIAALSVGGCNSGACHGTPSGKNGFRLSLRGYDPSEDYLQLTRDVFGRRTDRLDPEASLIRQKALGRVPHEGGRRFVPDSVPAQVMLGWLAEGLRDDPAGLPALETITLSPGTRVLHAPGRWQQLAVQAHFADGSAQDVTRLTVFSTSDPAVAGVTATGLVQFQQSGEVAVLCRYLDQLRSVRLTYLQPRPGFQWPNPPENNYVDQHVFGKLKMLSIAPAELCTDQEFIRRASMDLCGVLPSVEETRAFLASTDKERRARLIDALLERSEYADFWTLKWSDVLRSHRKTIQQKGIHVYQDWLHDQVEHNTPFDQVVRSLLTASGDPSANPPANYYCVARDPQNVAEMTAQLFLGIRMQCAKCHNHPFERWTQDDYYSLAAFFARVKYKPGPSGPNGMPIGVEFIYPDRSSEVIQPRTRKVMPPRFLGGQTPVVPTDRDRREVLADWLTSDTNPFFARSVVNRIWFHLNRRGIVDPVDDFRDSNPAANDALLDALARDFVLHHYDVKHIIRAIMTSRTYQLSAQTNAFNQNDNKYFSHAETRVYTAEQLLDAVCTVTGVPEKYPGLPLGTRSVQLPDSDEGHPFLKAFGQPGRELACECEREADSNLSQTLQMINGPTINKKVGDPGNRLGRLLAAKASPEAIINELFLAALSRPPAQAEVKAIEDHLARVPDQRKAWEDVLWTMLNMNEFLFRH